MDNYLPHHQADPRDYPPDSAVPVPDEEIEFTDEPATETLMEALGEVIDFDEDTGNVTGCENDFRHTEEVLRRHEQSEMAQYILPLLRAQGAECDCEVLLNSRIDLVFLEDDIEEFEEDEEEAAI